MNQTPGLFGLRNTNRDFSNPRNWGKNQFNNAFPIALSCYMSNKKLAPIYIFLDEDLNINKKVLKVEDAFGINPLSEKVFYAFESEFSPFQLFINGILPRIDVVINKVENNNIHPIRGLEIKLTALPDNQTVNCSQEEYGSEIVVRPDTIVYLALNIVSNFATENTKLLKFLEDLDRKIDNWTSILKVSPFINYIAKIIDNLLKNTIKFQKPLMLQPIWKTKKQSLVLEENCLDIFIWSDYAFTRLFIDSIKNNNSSDSISRLSRTVIWLYKMLFDFAKNKKIDHRNIIDNFTYDTRNDKAFALSGLRTRTYMQSKELIEPRITKTEIKKIILGGGQNLLSPERRFDAAILSTPELFY